MTRSRNAAGEWLAEAMDGQRPQVTVLSAYRFHLFELARQLDERQLLKKLVTAMPERAVTELPPERMTCRPMLAVARYAAHKVMHVRSAHLDRLVIADFDKWASTRIPRSDVDRKSVV